jgi:hypothetical protein
MISLPKLYSQLRAIEALSVGSKEDPKLNARGEKILKWLRRRYYVEQSQVEFRRKIGISGIRASKPENASNPRTSANVD